MRLRMNTVVELVRAAGLQTAYADKHPAYDLVRGPSGIGLSEGYFSEQGTTEILSSDDDDDDLPSFKKILARLKQVIDLTHDNDGDSEADDGNHTEVSWLRYTRTAQYRVTLILLFLIDHIQVADTALEVNGASSSLRDRPHNEHNTGSMETDDL
jgi:hypothetical protein